MSKKAYLVLSSGEVFEGERIGAEGSALGELVFTTGMVGYLETLTDPSYAGQIIMQTFPLIGNYGVIPEDFEGAPLCRGYVVREECETPSNFRSEYALDEFLKANNIPGIKGVDTRALTRIIREEGVMNAAIVSSLPADTDAISAYTVTGAVALASSREIKEYPGNGPHVVLIDYGAKRNILRCLLKRGCRVTVVPHDTEAERILSLSPDGIMLSNGPGDPAENVFEIAQIKKLLGVKPIFGICLGHQLTALAAGGATVKLKYGHRGGNQPAKHLKTGRTYITSQNHGYAVVAESMAGRGEVSWINANDGTVEGMDYPELNASTVQFHPEAHGGPQDTEWLFDEFVDKLNE